MGDGWYAKHKFPLIGALAGGAVGYLYRPSAFLTGQLPFIHVISRGRTLKGFDQVLVPLAEKSFNYLVAGLVLGAALGFVVKTVLSKNRKDGDRTNGQ